MEEKYIDLAIARYVREELEAYDGVTVCLTREDDSDVELAERTQAAVDAGADLLVSLHNNAYGKIAYYSSGCTVLASRGVWKPDLAEEEQGLAACVLRELAAIGLEDQGILLCCSENGKTYPNGETADYYAIIRNGTEQDLPSILIEHCFMDTQYEEWLADDETLRKLAKADADGIAKYYGLRRKDTGEIMKAEGSWEETLMLVTDGLAAHNRFSTKTFGADVPETLPEGVPGLAVFLLIAWGYFLKFLRSGRFFENKRKEDDLCGEDDIIRG